MNLKILRTVININTVTGKTEIGGDEEVKRETLRQTDINFTAFS